MKRTDTRASKDRLEMAGQLFHENVYKGYQEVIKKFPNRFIIIDATKSFEEVLNNVIFEIKKILKIK
jgi:dTMP kinase